MTRTLAALLLTMTSCAHQEPKTSATAPSGGAVTGPAATVLQGLVLPPLEAGAFNSSVSGCAAEPKRDEPATRSMPRPEKVDVTGVSTGVVLGHVLPHACCLTAATAVAVVGGKVTITETLSGTPCRCLCDSTLRTAVGLGKGSWSIEVRTVAPSGTRVAWTGDVTVP